MSSAGEFFHGKTSPLKHDSKGVYAGLPQDLPVTRYHSLVGTHLTLPKVLEVSSWLDRGDGSQGLIMGVRHKEYAIEGVQFHPESILSASGRLMFQNFVRLVGGTWAENEAIMKNLADINQKASGATPQNDTNGTAQPSPPKKNNILQKIYAHRKAAVAAQKQIPSQRMQDLKAAYRLNAAPPQISLVDRIRKSPFDVALMAEIKRASPSKGVFALDIDAPTQARKYALAGASVISVLTEPEWFKGSIEDLRAVRQVLNGMPNRPAVLRKEFVFEEYQILEARLAGADTVLLIVKMLEQDLLERLYKYSLLLGMEPVVEVQNADEMTVAVKMGAKVIGVNNRNLESFEVDLGTTGRLRSMVPKETFLCALSGINSHKDVTDCIKDGVNGILVGEAIMRAPDASVFIQELCAGSTPTKTESKAPTLLAKICGTRTAEAASEAVKAGADMIGIILVPGTKRFVVDETALAISKVVHENNDTSNTEIAKSSSGPSDFFSLTAKIISSRRPLLVGVFMNQPLEDILEKQRLHNLDVVQLHGNEPLEWASIIPVPVVKKFKPGQPGVGTRGYHALPLLDSGAGDGKLLDLDAVRATLQADENLHILLAGGLSPDNVAESVKALGPLSSRVIGVDVSSGVEEDGKQSLERIRAFVQAAKAIR